MRVKVHCLVEISVGRVTTRVVTRDFLDLFGESESKLVH
jgi:hypothetical protein